jgi:endogenous inhibitor of DNA gyrase (YacG/DUF329 family)
MLCPICETEFDPQEAASMALPFCSARCKQIDLGRWLGGRYTLPGAPLEEGEDTVSEDEL